MTGRPSNRLGNGLTLGDLEDVRIVSARLRRNLSDTGEISATSRKSLSIWANLSLVYVNSRVISGDLAGFRLRGPRSRQDSPFPV